MIKNFGFKMLKSSVLAVISCAVFVSLAPQEAQAKGKQTKAVEGCKATTTLPNGNFIYKNSAPLRSGGIGTPLIGYRIEPTLIMNRNFGRGTITVYGTDGTKIGSCPWTDAHGHSGGRARCTMNTRSLRAAARRSGGTAAGIFKVGSACVKVPDLGRCYGSVKGLCNRLIS